ncbi:alpha/beta hydrolase [Algoriphagus zhangzhouensis]|uniref:Predicted esterase n=1 Tax=Algoriphagus zhangzhouensis TaxID=1073327 RepID=A0A1M7ZFZ2_9BACT|nr:alpha/beta hydrolase [Algoriphagus zhangzhouensis]TDY44873.1 putative esterase [Algoriphagus zhangzhouensis]SHO63835.1 Predicted esterase [Algoriphagus zhangzhouensis]
MKKSFQFPFEAHYVISHEPNFQESEIWIVFHGYGHLAEFFIRKFNPFFSSERLFIAPEGTNYAYLQNFQGRVGANWMTKHERETAISNNHRFLDGLMESILQSYSILPKINILGFSQGAATATRWASRWTEKVEHLVLWAGGFAHDLELMEAKEKFSLTKFTIVLGNQDSMITQESLEKQGELVKNLEKTVEIIHFEGGHELNQEVLKKLFE